jgi:Holliday junction resolvase RusA-like endonuclease
VIEVERVVEVFVPGTPPTPNARLGHMAKARTSKLWRMKAASCATDAKPEDWVALSLAEIEVMMIVPDDRRRDWDNAIAARKPLMDGLVDAGVLTDDSNRVVKRLGFGFAVRHGVAGTLIRVRAFRTE